LPSTHPLATLHHNKRHLQQQSKCAITPQLLGDATHDEFMSECANEEGDHCCSWSGHHGQGGAVNMPPKEMMDRHVPFAGEFKLEEMLVL